MPGIAWVSSPGTIDPPRIGRCDRAWRAPHAVASLDPVRGPLLEVEGMHWWLDAPNPDYPFRRWIAENFDAGDDEAIVLLVDRRVPAALLVPFVAAAREVGVSSVKVDAAAIATFPTIGGRMITWNICTLGELAVDPFLARELSGRTWGDVVVDGALVGPEPEREVPSWGRY